MQTKVDPEEIKRIKREIEALEKERKEIRAKLEELDKELQIWIQKRDEKNNEVKQLRQKGHEYKAKRDEINAQIQELKKNREEINAKLDLLYQEILEYRTKRDEYNQLRRLKMPPAKIQERIEKLEWELQTNPNVTPEREKQIVDQIQVLATELEIIQQANRFHNKLVETRKKVDQLKKARRAISMEIQKLANQSQQFHEQMIKAFNEADEIKKEADEYHAKVVELREKIREVRKELREIEKKIQEYDERHKELIAYRLVARMRSKKDASFEKAVEALEKFKRGEKLSLDELLLLQRYNLV
ncbi:coiled-coil protein [Thermococcus celer]|uniref:Phosphoserine phosphatase n=1 Tax=Thermococcus celer Vu 13 = JCM 8558 TaxID=1293037 RepID=A0A218P2T0_THECE|nr:coiled-coil protein [Thermococcus celer]ASI99222.1 phosphoserine phosphatase [Thermococcus celer Vu 13 = JCM 8558]